MKIECTKIVYNENLQILVCRVASCMLEVYAQELATAEILSVWSYFLASDGE